MGKYRVDCEIYWGSKYDIEAETEEEAEEIAKEQFIKDYCLSENPHVSGFGITTDVEEL